MLIPLSGFSGNSFFFEGNSPVTTPQHKKIKIYLDCNNCNSIFFRRQMPFVDFVRDQKLADVHVFVTTQSTASGSIKYHLNFIGFNKYADIQYKLEEISPQNETNILKWKRLLKIIETGLLPYLSRTPEIAQIRISHNNKKTPVVQNIDDTWNYWVFRLTQSTKMEYEKSRNEYTFWNSIRADRITDMIKFRTSVSYNYDKETYTQDDEKIESKKLSAGLNTNLIYSLTPKWSAGITGNFSSSSYYNSKFSSSLGSAIEYNIYPWDKSDQKVFTLSYHLKAHYYEYKELTIYNKFKEWKGAEGFELSYISRQPWGEIENTIAAYNYFYDFSKNNLSMRSSFSLNVVRGFYLYMNLRATCVHDQLYLPAGEVTAEEILLKQQKLATNFEFSARIGFRITFGSIYNNIVNQRL